VLASNAISQLRPSNYEVPAPRRLSEPLLFPGRHSFFRRALVYLVGNRFGRSVYRFFSRIKRRTFNQQAEPSFFSNFNYIPCRNHRRQSYFSTLINSPVDALTATVSLAPSRLEP
jgi:hypothetical protein